MEKTIKLLCVELLEFYHLMNNIFNKTNQLLKIFKHRGPDNTGIWIDKDNQISLGHLRLSILDLSSSINLCHHQMIGIKLSIMVNL